MRRFGSLVERLEEIPVGPTGWAASFLAIVAVRHLLELRSGGYPIYPASAFYVHYVLAYLAPLLALCLVLALFSGVRLERVLRLMLLAWGLTLLPPIVDTLSAHARDPRIGYLELGDMPWLTVVLRFFDPTYPLGGTTPGIRVETALACLLAVVYTALRAPRARLARCAGAAAAVYGTSIFFFTVPYLFARALGRLFPGFSPALIYNSVGRVARPENLGMRGDQVVLIYLVPLTLALAAVSLALVDRALLRRAGAALAFSEGWGWAILCALGAQAGWRVLQGLPRDIATAPFDLLALAAGPAALVLGGAALALLDPAWPAPGARADSLQGSAEERAEQVHGARALARAQGRKLLRRERGAGVVLLAAAAILASCASSDCAALAAIALGAGFLARGLPRLLPWALLVPQVAAGIAGLAAFLAGWALPAADEALTLLPAPLLLFAFLAGFAADLPRFGTALVRLAARAAARLASGPALALAHDRATAAAGGDDAPPLPPAPIGGGPAVRPDTGPQAHGRPARWVEGDVASIGGEPEAAPTAAGSTAARSRSARPVTLRTLAAFLARLAPAGLALVPLIALLVSRLSLPAPIARGTILMAVLVTLAVLATTQVLGLRQVHGSALSFLGAALVLGTLLSDPAQSAAWRVKALAAPTYFLRLAERADAAGDLDAAAGAAAEALQRAPQLSSAHQRLGLIRYKRGDYPGAVAELAAAVALDPHDADLQGNLATALLKTGRTDEALAVTDRALAIEPELAKLLFIRAQCLDAQGKTALADAAWQRYVDHARGNAEEAAALAAALRRLAGQPAP